MKLIAIGQILRRRRAARDLGWRSVLTLLGIAALAAGLHFHLARSRPSPSARQVTLKEVRLAADVVWVDARQQEKYYAAHLPGAINLTEANWEQGLAEVMAAWQPTSRFVIYCDDAACGTAERVATRLRRELQGASVAVLMGGWVTLREAEMIFNHANSY